MSEQSLPQPIPLAAGPFDPSRALPAPAQRPQCRALTSDGHRCKNKVVGGLHLCFSHYRNRRPALPEPRNASVPLLEDHSAIQLMATQILQGVLSLRIDPLRARAALYALHIAALTLPRQVAPTAPAAPAEPEPAADSVYRLGRDHEDFISVDGDLTAPPLNPSCSVPASDEALRELLDTLQPLHHGHPENEPEDPPQLDPTHDADRCQCFTCTDYRAWIAQKIEDARDPAPPAR
jgi:hypothetical protein